MDNQDYRVAGQHLLSAAMVLAPNGKVQRSFYNLYNDADLSKEDEPEKKRCQVVAGAIFDGLAYGNWPTT